MSNKGNEKRLNVSAEFGNQSRDYLKSAKESESSGASKYFKEQLEAVAQHPIKPAPLLR